MNSNNIGPAATFNFFGLSSNNTNIVLPIDDLYVDTNSWFDVAANRTHGPDVEAFLRRFVSKPGPLPIILWSPHNNDELMECIYVDEYRKEAQRRGMNPEDWKQLENTISTHDAAVLNQKIIHRHNSFISQFSQSLYEINKIDVEPTTREIMSRYGLSYKDSKHLAYMWHEETNNLLTRDRRFANVPGLNIFSPQIRSNGVTAYSIDDFMPDLPKTLKENKSNV